MAFSKNNLFETDEGVSIAGNTAGLIKSGKGTAFFSGASSQKVTYLNENGDVDFIEFFSGSSQIVGNRLLKISVGYTNNEPSSETWEFYDSNGTTVLETRVYSFGITDGSIQTVTESIT